MRVAAAVIAGLVVGFVAGVGLTIMVFLGQVEVVM